MRSGLPKRGAGGKGGIEPCGGQIHVARHSSPSPTRLSLTSFPRRARAMDPGARPSWTEAARRLLLESRYRAMGWTDTHFACANDEAEVLEAFLAAGGDPEIVSGGNWHQDPITLLSVCCMCGSLACLEVLLESGVGAGAGAQKDERALVDSQDADPWVDCMREAVRWGARLFFFFFFFFFFFVVVGKACAVVCLALG